MVRETTEMLFFIHGQGNNRDVVLHTWPGKQQLQQQRCSSHNINNKEVVLHTIANRDVVDPYTMTTTEMFFTNWQQQMLFLTQWQNQRRCSSQNANNRCSSSHNSNNSVVVTHTIATTPLLFPIQWQQQSCCSSHNGHSRVVVTHTMRIELLFLTQ